MKFVTCSVANYKSFHRPTEISFAPGFNILVGRNNAGKTALLEALSLRFANKPHRSLASAPRPSDALPPASEVSTTFSVPGRELTEILQSRLDIVNVPFPVSTGSPSAEAANTLFGSLRDASQISVGAHFEGGQLRYVRPLTVPYEAGPIANAPCAQFRPDKVSGKWAYAGNTGSDGNRLEWILAHTLYARTYSFRAERLNVGMYRFGFGSELEPDAHNLPEVLNSLQSRNPARFRRYNELVARVFPTVRWVGVRPVEGSQLEVIVWEYGLDTERQDLAVPLSESGTGISQVLAMLYVVVTADADRIFIIDEPNSFLHPGAVRALLEIFHEHPRHQYIVSTHSPQTVASIGPTARTHLLQKNADLATVPTRIDPGETAHVRDVLAEVGARISDVFGAETVLWVEGATEEQCFRLIIEEALRLPLRSMAVVGVRNTGDFDRRNARWALELYRRVSSAGALMPPAIGFIFDRELRSPSEIDDITRQSRGAVSFLPSRMYENHLLVPGAIAAVLAARGVDAPVESVTADLARRRGDPRYFPREDRSDPMSIDGAAVLREMFAALSAGAQEYAKVRDGAALTSWLLEHDADALSPVVDLLREKLQVPLSRA